MILGLIPAAGKSTRMGRPKLALRLGEYTILEHVIRALRGGGVEQVLVVVGPHGADLISLARSAGALALRLTQVTPDMRATVEAGLDWLEQQFRPQAADAWLLAPADHPTLHPKIIERLLAARQMHPAQSIFLPCFDTRRGHPTLIAWKHVSELRAQAAGEGINALLRRHQLETLELPVDDPGVLTDLDTPEDYERLQRDARWHNV